MNLSHQLKAHIPKHSFIYFHFILLSHTKSFSNHCFLTGSYDKANMYILDIILKTKNLFELIFTPHDNAMVNEDWLKSSCAD